MGNPPSTNDSARSQSLSTLLRRHLVIGGQHLEQMAVGVAKIDPPPPVIMIDRHILGVSGAAAIFKPLSLQACEDLIEFLLGNFEGVVMRFKFLPAIKIER